MSFVRIGTLITMLFILTIIPVTYYSINKTDAQK